MVNQYLTFLRSVGLTTLAATLSWALLVDALGLKLLGEKPPHHGKVSFNWGGAVRVFWTLFFFQNVFPILISKGTTLPTSFRNILFLIDIIQWLFLFWFARVLLQEKKMSVHKLSNVCSYNFHPTPKKQLRYWISLLPPHHGSLLDKLPLVRNGSIHAKGVARRLSILCVQLYNIC